MLATSATRLDEHARVMCRCVGMLGTQVAGRIRLTDHRALCVRRLLLAEVHLQFANVYSRPIRVRRASQVPQGRVPRGVHGKAR